MRVATVIPLNVGMDSPVFCLLKFLDDERIGVGVSLDVTKEPGWQRFGDVVVVDVGGRVQVLDKDGVVRPSCSTHNSALVDVLDVSGLHGESVDDNGEVRYLSAVFFESFWTFDSIGGFIRVEAMLEIFNGRLTSSPNGIEASVMFGLLRCESFCKSTIPSCLGCGQGLVDAFLGVVTILLKGGNEGLVSILVVDGVTQLADSRASDVLGQGSNGFGRELIFPVVDEGEGALGIDDGDFGHLQDFGRHLEVNLGSKDFAVFKRVIGRG